MVALVRLGPGATTSICLLLLAAIMAGCGKKGPPLPPLVKLPAPPADFTAERRGAHVDLQFTAPSANTDGTRPANVARVDVYGFTGVATVTDEEFLKRGTKVASVPVKAPRDPNDTIEADEPRDQMEPPEGPGLDQGAEVRVRDELTEASFVPAPLTRDEVQRLVAAAELSASRPLLGPPPITASRSYASVGVTKRGRMGPVSTRVAVPLVPPPPPPAPPSIHYDETTITVTWTPIDIAPVQEQASGDVLPATPIGPTRPAITYKVYEVPSAPSASTEKSGSGETASGGEASDSSPTRQAETALTKTSIAETHFSDDRIEWGAERCYIVRAVATVDNLPLESDAASPVCTTLVDTFPPAAPKGLTGVATEGAVSLIWQANDEKDLAGYLLFRAPAPSEDLTAVFSTPMQETTFRDTVQPGIRYVYAVAAVDNAGNRSPMSNRVEETAR